MFKKTFGTSGIHPDDSKKLTFSKNIVSGDIPNRAYVPISQHIGNPAKIIVNIGDKVEEGQLIAIGDGFISSNVHASIPGVVTEIIEVYTPNGKKSKAVVIELGGEFRKTGKINNNSDWKKYSKEKIINIIKDSGIVGLGGATFPTHVKLTVPQGKNAHTLIINGAECEPYLTCDHRLLLDKSESIIEGTLIINAILNASKVYIGIESNKKDAISRLKTLCRNKNTIKIVPLKVKYPQGDEKQIIKAVSGIVVPVGKLPIDCGVVVVNTSTVHAITEAVTNDKPLIERVVTVSGGAIRHPKNLSVRIGTKISELIEECGGVTDDLAKIIVGGPMMGFAQMDQNSPVTKGTSGIICLSNEEASSFKTENICINCGKCIQACAFGLMPTMMNKYINHKLYDKAVECGISNCKECGACAWVCPAGIPLVQNFRQGKYIINKLTASKG